MEDMRYTILMDPDYGEALFWDKHGCNIGGYDYLFIGDESNVIEIELSSIDDLKEWFWEWDHESLNHTNNWTLTQWKEWWERGLKLAKEIKAILPKNVDLYYFTIQDSVWTVRPEESNDGGIFNYGEPMKITL